MTNVLNRVEQGSFLLLVSLFLPATGLEAACPEGYMEEEDCSAKEEHIKDCEDAFEMSWSPSGSSSQAA